MSGKVILMFALTAALLVSSAASSPESFTAGEARQSNLLQKLLVKKEKMRDSSSRQEPGPQTLSARMERRAHLSEDEREIMTKQIMQAITGNAVAWGVKVIF